MFKQKKYKINRIILIIVVFIAVILGHICTQAASLQQETGSKEVNAWPETRSTGKTTQQRPTNRNIYKSKDSPVINPSTEAGKIGVTIWKLLELSSSDNKAIGSIQTGEKRLVEAEESGKVKKIEMVPQRINQDTILKQGDKIWLNIEVPKEGYLYIVDREQYANGSYGTPYLIYPTKKYAGGNNKVAPGIITEIPSQTHKLPFLVLEKSDATHTAEVISIIVTNEPIPGIIPSEGQQALSKELFAQWEKWGNPIETERYELEGGLGLGWTATEKQVGQDGSKRLKEADPLPQTVYRIATKSTDPMMVSVPLKIQN